MAVRTNGVQRMQRAVCRAYSEYENGVVLIVSQNQVAACLPRCGPDVLRKGSRRCNGPLECRLDGVRCLDAGLSFVFDLLVDHVLVFVSHFHSSCFSH
jgi:hypothetical protein